MAEIVIIGAGPTGLTAAMKFAQLGASVVVLERDASPMPGGAEEAWEQWERRAVPQFRQVHHLQPGGRVTLDEHCPAVIEELLALGGVRLHSDVMFVAPDPQPDPDPRFETVTTCRRPVMELAFARAAAATPGVEVRRGVVVEGLTSGAEVLAGVPHVTGVRLEGGETVAADLVIDAGGRRSAVGAMLEAIGGRAMVGTSTEVGFAYTTRFFRGDALPEYRSDLLTPLGSISALTVHGDNGTWSVTLYAHPADKPMRRLRDADTFNRVVGLLPNHAHWLDGEAITDPASLTSTANTVRDFVVDGVPVATGIIPLGDAHAFTNPSIGRGISIGIIHAVSVAEATMPVLDAPAAVAKAWEEATTAKVRGFVDAAIVYDTVRGPEVEAAIRGEVHEHSDPMAQMFVAVDAARRRNQHVFEGWRAMSTLQATTAEVMAIPGWMDGVMEHGAEPWRFPMPSRQQLLDAVA